LKAKNRKTAKKTSKPLLIARNTSKTFFVTENIHTDSDIDTHPRNGTIA